MEIKAGMKIKIVDNSRANRRDAYRIGEIFEVDYCHRSYLYIIDNFGRTRSLQPYEYELVEG